MRASRFSLDPTDNMPLDKMLSTSSSRLAALAAWILLALMAGCLNGCSTPYAGLHAPASSPAARPPVGGPWGAPARSTPSSGLLPLSHGADELVILERNEEAKSGRFFDDGADALPGGGALVAHLESRREPLQLVSTDAALSVLGPVVQGTLRQSFHNPFSVPIEASYVFPLPENAAVHDFLLTVGDRRIRGIIREREEARRIYEAARSKGLTASLLSQWRPNAFMQKVANIAPGKAIDVTLSYLDAVDHRDGWQEIAFPMVVGPRYFPVGAHTGEAAETLKLKPRSGRDIELTVSLDAGLDVKWIESPSHRVTIAENARGAVVTLQPASRFENVDFRLRWKVAGDGLRTSLFQDGEHALLTLYPPTNSETLERRPVDHVFLLDTSGSMSGEPVETMQDAMHAALLKLDPRDTFHIFSFSDRADKLSRRPMLATRENIAKARRYIDRLKARGGTEMLSALKKTINAPTSGHRPRVITLMSDGLIGNEEEIFREIQSCEEDVRFFTVGLGTNPNRYLLSEMSRRSGGSDAYLSPASDATEEMTAYFRRASRPAVAGLNVRFEGARADAAASLPRELLAGRPVTIPFRLDRVGGAVSAIVEGRVAGAFTEIARVDGRDVDSGAAASLGKVWARARVAALDEESATASGRRRSEIAEDITNLSLRHGLVSEFTSFLAVDSAGRGSATGPIPVNVGHTVPAGVIHTVGG